ncbi:MAG: lysylphosphatidylglycerol synthase domain-containing protein, partial [Bacteroidota bacterium]
IAIFLLTREGVNLGKSLSYVLVASVCDNLCFITAASLGLGGAYGPIFTGMSSLEGHLGSSLQLLFWSSYTFLLIYTLTVLLSLLFWPSLFKWVLVQVTSLPFLKRWQPAARQHGDEIIMASSVLKGEKVSYWLRAGLATMVLWSSKYLILNFLIASYVSLSLQEHLLVFGKQLVIWTVMLVSPTPGSSGTAEFFYQQLHGEALGGYTLITAVLWRAMTSYYYLMLGAIVLPYWLRRAFSTPKSTATQPDTAPPSAA